MLKELRYLFCFLLFSSSLFSQNNHFINLNREDGLASNFVRAIHQDNYGYMWFGTDNGLNRFDGIQIDTYRHSSSNEFSLSDNNIQDIFQTSSGKLLICTSLGIDVFDYNTEQFKHINFIGNYDLKKIIETADHKIWIVTNNNIILVLDANLKMLNPIDLTQLEGNHSKLSNNLWTSMYDENSLALYDVTSGFYLLDINTKKLTLLTSDVLPRPTTIFKISPINKSEFWVTTFKGVFICKNGVFSKRFIKGDTSNKKNLTSNFVLDLKKMPNNEVWLFTDGGGINIYNLSTKQFRYIENNIDDSYSLGSNFIFTTFLGKNGTLWLGTIKNGVSQLDSENPFTTYKLISHDQSKKHNIPASSLFLDSKNQIWVGSDGNGLYKLENNIMEHVYFDKNVKTIPSINQISTNTLILGTYKNGISTFNSSNRKLTKQTAIDQHLDLNTKVTFIKKDNDGSFWIGGDHILNFDPVKKQQIYNSNTPLNSINLRALSFKTHSKDTLLFGGIFGLYQYDSKGIKMISNIPNAITSIIKNKQNSYWLATNKGLCLIDLKTKKTTFYSTESGINIAKVNSLVKDDSNNVWMGTGQGISKFDIRTKTFSNYTYKDGFSDNSFNRPIVTKNKSGHLYFGGIKGVLTFHPDSIKPTSTAKKVLFTKILVNHEELKNDKQIGLQQPIEETKQLVLNYSQKILTINFSSFNFKHPEKVHFLYKLEGYDEDWQSTSKRSLTYMNLSPKDYILKIKASNISNQWSDAYSSLQIKVLPTWWQTYWFKLSVLFSFILIIYLMNRIVLKKEQAKRLFEFERKSLKEQKDMDEKQLRFFTNLSHEIRTPLSLILSPVENIIKEAVSPKTKNNLALIQKNAIRIERLINRVIDFRKTEFKEPEIQASKENIVFFLKEITESFSSFSKSKNIELIFNAEVETLLLWFDRHMMETIFFNLLSNAFKYSHSNGKIIFSITSTENQVCIKVQDSGQGIAPEDLTHIFERFYQSKSHIGGSGIGLALTKRFVEAHKGTVEVVSKLEEGSTFKVCFPLGNKHFDKSNLVEISNQEKLTLIENDLDKTDNTVYNSELKNNTILVVEDAANLRDYLSTNLSNNYRVITAENGKEGLEMVKNNKIDLIVSDITMPEMDGIELCKLLKENVKTCNIPIILLTAKALKEDKIKGYETGADAYLEKPFQLDYLYARINNLLENKMRQKNQLLDTLNISVDDDTINNSDQKFYKQSIAIIETHISNPDFNIPMFTKELGMSKSLVYKKMAKITSLSLNDLILSIRLQRASQMLIHTEKSIVEISALVGFKNSKYFSTSFKKKFKLSPSTYRTDTRNLNKNLEG